MSRVERKKLEKEKKKSKNVFKFKKEVSAPIKADINIKNEHKKEKLDKSLDNKNSIIEDKQYKSSKNRSSNNKSLENNIRKNINDSPGSLERTITADRIVSVEDERAYFERKKTKKNIGDEKSNFMTVDDIITAEDEKNGINKDSVSEVVINEDKEVNINKVKKIHIEKATFEDVVKVAESRKQAKEKEPEKYLYTENGDVVDMEDNKKKEQGSKLLNSVDSVSKANIDDLYESVEKKKKSKKEKIEKINPTPDLNNDSSNDDKSNDDKIILNEKSDIETPINTRDKNSNGFKKIIFGLAGIIIVVYVVGCIVFNGRYFANTKINGIEAGFKTPESVENTASQKIDSYSINISGRKNVKDSINGSDIDLEFIKDDSAKNIKKDQGVLAWPIAFFKDYNYDGKLNIRYDKSKLEAKLDKLQINDKKNIVAPKSAVPMYDDSKKELKINKGDLGSTPIKSKLVGFLDKSIRAQKNNTNYPDSVYKGQKYDANSTKVKRAVSIIKPYVGTKIVYDFEYEKYKVPGQDIVSMFDFDEEGNYNVKLSKDKVREVVRNLSRKYSTYGDAREIQSASTGGKLKVGGGIYGWLIDREKETDALYKIVKSKNNVNNRKPIYSQTAVSRQKNDMGDEFIEIDLTKQHMWYIKGGETLVSTPIVSGNPYHGDATPTGIYPLNYKTRNAVLRGPGYASPVAYWMPFNGGIGIHDSSWQAAYGGSRYLYAGSHGCINTPYADVAKIYELSKEGMPIVVHD